ncbi:transglutaminase-like cysteine peptidase [Thiomicrorhabdus heinhorstiae]|uniref:Transglutaminase-like cysteine peptidase n=1 Tax=Thiomicrorhabdus heinhorstiae TaxID=2748010 RepID=A0ABS0BVK9_9GAMM|nr:transglutaminase-like cysteine peptidase [Thiomicrorhabdus heinhorstiae]MBF6057866.1 transglutaminase-like cysteine peptidase [Thiomicrorhabdus heinhorstiae]
MLNFKNPRYTLGLLLLAFIGTLSLSSCSTYREEPSPTLISDQVIRDSEKNYGYFAPRRLETWNEILQQAKNLPEIQQVKFINQRFNEIPYNSDYSIWKTEDYWATPFEFLAKDAGDCEDYSIAKYTALRNLNVPITSLNLAYVRKLPTLEPHMVLLYGEEDNNSPLVLDNEIKVAFPLKDRADLMVIYKFNEKTGYLVNGQKNGYEKTFDVSTIKRWKNYLQRPSNYTLLKRDKEEKSGFFSFF